MKNSFCVLLLFVFFLNILSVFSQSKEEPVSLGLPGDDLDLFAVMEVFQNSKTIEDFEKSLNDDKSKLNNLDLDRDQKVDFIKVITNKDGDSFSFILQVAVNKTENQDVAVIFVSKDKNGKVAMQIVGDEAMYGKDYVVEPKGSGSGTINPGYGVGSEEIMNLPAAAAPTTTVVVQSAPIIRYVYSPVYVPYYPTYYYGFYPPYYRPWIPVQYGIYWSNHYHCHARYYGGYRGSVNININNINNYNRYSSGQRRTSSAVANNKANGIYGNRPVSGNNMNKANSASTRPSLGNSATSRPATGSNSATRPATGNSAVTRPATRPATGNSAVTRPATRPTTGNSAVTRPATRPATGNSAVTRPSTRPISPSAGNNSATRPVPRPASPSGSAPNRASSGSFNRPSSSNSSFNSGSSNRGNYGGGRSGGYSSGGFSSGGRSGGSRVIGGR